MFRSPHHPFHAGLMALAAAFALDQGTKWWIAEVVMRPPQTIPVAPSFNLMLHRNTGVSFGLFAGNGEAGRWALVAVALAVIAMLCVWMVRAERAWVGVALGLVAGGAISNVVDRLRHGGVTDFLDFHYAGWHWPSFNLADAAICIGVALLLLDGFLGERRQEAAGLADGRQP